VVIHGAEHARAVLRHRRPVCLLSAPGAGRLAGAGWWRAVIAAALAAAWPDAGAERVRDALDCDAAAGAAMAALRHGQRLLLLDPRCPGFAAVAGAADAIGARLLDRRPPALDMLAPTAPAMLEPWLAGHGTGGAAGDTGPGAG
jgi:hypothetical protein